MGMDEEVMPYIDMANIACGFHASDPFIMAKTVKLAKAQGVSIGAHPSYPDLHGFGRRDMSFSAKEIKALIHYQVGALQGICRAQGVNVEYIKPHGALYNLMMRDEAVLSTIMQALAELSDKHSNLPLLVLADQQAETIQQKAKQEGVSVLFEAFCDRAYNDDGSLVSRKIEGAVLEGEEAIQQRIHELLSENRVTTITGKQIPIAADTICVHGDTQHALDTLKKIRAFIDKC